MTGAFPKCRRFWKHHFYFINADRIGAIFTICLHSPHVFKCFQNEDYDTITLCIWALVILGFSESLEFLRQRKKKDFEFFDMESQTKILYESGLKKAYLLSHGTWHILAFVIAFKLHEHESRISLRH